MTRRTLQCDTCQRTNTTCPGVIAHCMSGQHCWDVEAFCAHSRTFDPCTYCCTCKKPDPQLFGRVA